MDANAAKKANMTNAELGAEELKRISVMVAEVKRWLEVLSMIPGASEESESDTCAFMNRYGITHNYKDDITFLTDSEKYKSLQGLSNEEYLTKAPESVFRYSQFLVNKISWRDTLRKDYCVPSNERMKKWRARQIERTKATAGSSYEANIHVPLNFELSDGCSVGCPFCAIGAEKLKSVFRYTEENAALFANILRMSKEIIGDAAGSGVLYYSSEPLDDPDYEKFAEDMFREFGRYPQITTAVALRNRPRMHELLKVLSTKPDTVFRFSVLSLEDALEIFREYSPEELIRVELLPQFSEAPSFVGFSNAGRARDYDVKKMDEGSGSICCISGFVVNLAAKTVRLITPINADDRFPTGEVIFDKKTFTDADDLKQIMLGMMERFMHNELPSEKKLKLYPYFRIEKSGAAKILRAPGYIIRLDQFPTDGVLRTVEALISGEYTAKELVDELTDRYGLDPVNVYWMMHFLWQKGAIDEFSEIAG